MIKKEGLLKKLKNVEDINNKQEKQLKFHSNLMIKAPSFKSIRNKEINNRNLDTKESAELFKALEDLEAKSIDYQHLKYKSGANKVFNFVKYGKLVSLYLKLTRGVITLKAKLNLEDFKKFYTSEERPKSIVNKFNELIVEKEKGINKELPKKHFKFQSLIHMQKHVYKTKNTNKSEESVNVINSGLIDLKNEIKKMSCLQMKK